MFNIDNLRQHNPEIKTATLEGILSIASSPFSKPTTNKELLAMALELGLPPEQEDAARQVIRNGLKTLGMQAPVEM